MRVFLKQTAVGPRGSFLGQREYDVPGEMPLDMAKVLEQAGYARWVDGPTQVETATAEPAPERAVPPWTLKTKPAAYLERHGPDAPNSELARRHLESDG